MPAKKIWTDEDLRSAILTSSNWNDVMICLGLSPKSESGKGKVRKRARELNIDFSHFIKKTRKGFRKQEVKDLFRKNVRYNTSIRRRFAEIAEYKCSNEECGISEWLGNCITLQVDHIDGDKTNNLLSNLRYLCPNCHAQTETWGVPTAYRK